MGLGSGPGQPGPGICGPESGPGTGTRLGLISLVPVWNPYIGIPRDFKKGSIGSLGIPRDSEGFLEGIDRDPRDPFFSAPYAAQHLGLRALLWRMACLLRVRLPIPRDSKKVQGPWCYRLGIQKGIDRDPRDL